VRFGFVGGSYTLQSVNADAQMAMNWYAETDESGKGKAPIVFNPTPGTSLFATLGGTTRGGFEINDRCFVVGGAVLYEMASNGALTNRGTVGDDGAPVSMCASDIHLLVASAGLLYVFNLSTSVFTAIAAATISGVSQVAICDSFFIASIKNTAKFRISLVYDALSWPGAQIIQVNVFPDNIISMAVDHRELWVLGMSQSVGYQATGSLQIFDVIPGSLMEQGAIATFAISKLDNSFFWLGGDDRGSGMGWRANGITPMRVSNHAVEFAWQGYSTIADAESYTYQDKGHIFWVIYFPTANKTWVYDVATQLWHERGFWNAGSFTAHRSRWHVFVFGKHLVGDWNSGSIYEMSDAFLDDFGNALRRVRRAPHISDESKWFFHHSLQIDVETGLGPQPPLLDGAGNPRGPMMDLRWSDDSHTWSNYYPMDCGQAGDFKKRAIWRRLGRSRDRVYEVAVSDAVPWRITDSYLEISKGSGE